MDEMNDAELQQLFRTQLPVQDLPQTRLAKLQAVVATILAVASLRLPGALGKAMQGRAKRNTVGLPNRDTPPSIAQK